MQEQISGQEPLNHQNKNLKIKLVDDSAEIKNDFSNLHLKKGG